MPFAIGGGGAHDDTAHQGSAKKGVASGVASLDAASKVVQNPVSRGAASGVASLDASSKVIEDHVVVNPAYPGGRALDTVYQNTTGRPLLVIVSAHDAGAVYTLSFITDSANPPTTLRAKVSNNGAWGSVLCGIIIPNEYYKVTNGNTINGWVEYKLQ